MKPALPFLAALALAVLAASYAALRPSATAPSDAAATRADPAASASPALPRAVEVVVRDGRRVSGPERVQLHQGERLTLRVLSDRADELHLHGYDLHLRLRAGVPATLQIEARHSGRFEYELHRSGLALGTLEVLPL